MGDQALDPAAGIAPEGLVTGAAAAVAATLRRAGLVPPDARPPLTPLTGGVSSDIWRVDLPGGAVCVKRALARLKTAAAWEAPLERNHYEAAWMLEAAAAVPGAAPRLLHADPVGRALVMAYLPPAAYRLWKEALLAGEAEPAVAQAVGRTLVAIHAATALRLEVAARFPTDAVFQAIRLEPYFLATAAAHPDLDGPLRQLARTTAGTKLALVHGDVSPKNILVGPAGPVFLDAECAWYGDPAFDLAFCLNHLLLKGFAQPANAVAYLGCFEALAEAYLAGVAWEPRRRLEARATRLLPGLLLARIDGKSPVEYLGEPARTRVRRLARRRLATLPAQQERLAGLQAEVADVLSASPEPPA